MPTRKRHSRRAFLKRAALGGTLLASAGASALPWRKLLALRQYPGALLGPSAGVGHQLRDGAAFARAEKVEQIGTLIVGGGVAGLSAGWWLARQGYRDFRLLELEPEVGGNSRSGRNSVSAYPCGAHYLPVPAKEARYVRLLLEELGAIRGYDASGLPIYEETYLCADPQERLLLRGSWQDGIVPSAGVSADDHREYRDFFARMEDYKQLRGRDGKRAFAIPIDESSRDPELLALDRETMDAFLARHGWSSAYLRWYVNYCCRDDYGRGSAHVSAWVGIHYFAARVGEAANAPAQSVLTWPEGNGWLVKGLREKLEGRIAPGTLVHSVEPEAHGALVHALEVATGAPRAFRAKQVIFAGPRFVAQHVVRGLPAGSAAYAPWFVANVTLSALPKNRDKGAPLSWDNVSFSEKSLGYVVATHQGLSRWPVETVLTYYLPLDHLDPAEARREALAKTHQDWCALVAAELERMHPGIEESITRIDAWVWGHGMVSPGVDFLWGDRRRAMLAPHGAVHFAHTDMSGISIFEEAQYRGVKAAEAALRGLGRHVS